MKLWARFSRVIEPPAPLTRTDGLVYLILVAFCFLSFEHGDMIQTAGSALVYLFGHVRDFYDQNDKLFWGIYFYGTDVYIGNHYMPSTYILFALWGIPLRLLGIVTDRRYKWELSCFGSSF